MSSRSLLLQIILVIIFIINVIIDCTEVELVADDVNDAENLENCKSLCEHCGCMGFYCGEECICECSSDNTEDLQCVSRMQTNCLKMKLPFEVLIQGPSGNRFVRSAFLLDQNDEKHPKEENRNKRSTVVIYKPRLALLSSPYTDLEHLENDQPNASPRDVTKNRREVASAVQEIMREVDKLALVQDGKGIITPKNPLILRPRMLHKNIHKPSPENSVKHSEGEDDDWNLQPIATRKRLREMGRKKILNRTGKLLPTFTTKFPLHKRPLAESLAANRLKRPPFKLGGLGLGLLAKKKEKNESENITTTEN